MAQSQKNLHAAKTAKNDEFYTQLADIENELKHYREQFRNKVVFLNCDDPFESNFFKYFANNFNYLGLKKLIATSYTKSPIAGTQLSLLDMAGLKPDGKTPFKIEINEVPDGDGDGAIDLGDIRYLLKNNKNAAAPLYGNGDFRSDECIELLKQSDIVCTNPPFSLIREYVAQLVEYGKRFLIIGPNNAITYKEIFKLIKDDLLWRGYGFAGGNAYFRTPNPREFAGGVYDEKTGLVKFRNLGWFTNMDFDKRHQTLQLYRKYTSEEYPTYDNYDAIEVSKVVNIPIDYDGVMGVPITFLDSHNPDQFEIVGMCENKDLYGLKTRIYTTKECQDTYFEHFGKKGTYDLNASGVINGRKVYQRLLIKRKAKV